MELLNEFLSIGIVGTMLSLGIQWVQDRYGYEGNTTKAIAVVGSIVLGGFVVVLGSTPYWASVVGVLAAASLVYSFVFSGVRKNEREDV